MKLRNARYCFFLILKNINQFSLFYFTYFITKKYIVSLCKLCKQWMDNKAAVLGWFECAPQWQLITEKYSNTICKRLSSCAHLTDQAHKSKEFYSKKPVLIDDSHQTHKCTRIDLFTCHSGVYNIMPGAVSACASNKLIYKTLKLRHDKWSSTTYSIYAHALFMHLSYFSAKSLRAHSFPDFIALSTNSSSRCLRASSVEWMRKCE